MAESLSTDTVEFFDLVEAQVDMGGFPHEAS